MKEIYFIRHAKTEKYERYDFIRKLTDIGVLQAKNLGLKFENLQIYPQIIFSSSAFRAKMTTNHILKNMNIDNMLDLRLYYIPEIYFFDCVEKMVDFIRKIDDKFEKIFVVGHNPAIAETANFLCKDFEIESFSPSSCLGVKFEVENFSQISQNSGEKIFYHNPKEN